MALQGLKKRSLSLRSLKMLVLNRHKDESIMVGDNVEIMIVGIRRNEIQLGINAPKSIPVYRKEVYGRICRERNGRGSQHLHPYRRSACAVAIRA
jgi:carbon storage regulator